MGALGDSRLAQFNGAAALALFGGGNFAFRKGAHSRYILIGGDGFGKRGSKFLFQEGVIGEVGVILK